MKNCFVLLSILLLTFPYIGTSQDHSPNELPFEVNRIYPPISITKEKLREAQTLTDLNSRYKSSWIKEYKSVEILTKLNGRIKKSVSNSDILSEKQKHLMDVADVGSVISVRIRYIPKNTLTHNDIKEIKFDVDINPKNEAQYIGGQPLMNQYLKEKLIDNIPDATFENYDLAAVKFTIDEAGQITDAHVFWPFKDEKVDDLLLEAICNMPNWKPAEYDNGQKVKQEFVLTLGNMKNCMVPLLNIDSDWLSQD